VNQLVLAWPAGGAAKVRGMAAEVLELRFFERFRRLTAKETNSIRPCEQEALVCPGLPQSRVAALTGY